MQTIPDHIRGSMLASMALLVASRKLGTPMTQQRAHFWMYRHNDVPWTISALAEATTRDRATVRDALEGKGARYVTRSSEGYMLSDEGLVFVSRNIVRFFRNLEEPYRSGLASMVRGKDEPLISAVEIANEWDTAGQKAGRSHCHNSTFAAMYQWRTGDPVMVKQICDITTYSPQSVNRELIELQREGVAARKGKAWVLKGRAHLKAVGMVTRMTFRTSPRILKNMNKLASFSKPTPP